MKRETKVGLLVGMGVILLVGIILSDHLSVVQQQDPAKRMRDFGPSADRGITNDGLVPDPGTFTDANQPAPMPQPARQIVPVPEPGETIKPPVTPSAPDTNAVKVAANDGQTLTPPPQPQVEKPAAVVADNAAPAKNVNIHIVKHGDTLYKLAFSAYGNGSKWDLIQKANPDVGPKGQLHEGQKLVIPADGVPEEMKKTGMFVPVTPANTRGQ